MDLKVLIAQLKVEERKFTTAQARAMGNKLGIDWKRVSVDQFQAGLEAEAEHDEDPDTDVVGPETDIGKIALVHLREIPDYYTRLRRMERRARADKER